MAGELPEVLRQLVTLRRKAGLSQAELARIIGTTQSAISELENGVTSPTLTTMGRYAGHLGMKLVVTVDGEVD